jgi:hypothetical protein
MTDKQNNQIKSWFIFAIAAIIGLAFRSMAIVVLISLLTVSLRDKDDEREYIKELTAKYKYIVYLPLITLVGFAVYLVYRAIVYRTRITLGEVLFPLIFILPLMIIYEYKLFRKNA